MAVFNQLFNGLGNTAIILVALIVLFIEIKRIKSDLKEFKNETKAEFANVRAELKDFKDETKAEFVSVHAEIRELRAAIHENSDKIQDLAERVSHQEGVELERRYSRIPRNTKAS